MNSFAYYNGTFGKKDEISIPLCDRSIFFGDAIYDAAIGSYDRIMWEDEHVERFLSNADKIGISHPYTKKYISSLLREIAIKSMIPNYFLYFQMSRCRESRIHSATNCQSSLLVTVDPFTPDENNRPLKLKTTEDKRYSLCNIKTTNLLPAVLASTEAEKCGCDEAVFVKDNIITECAKSNISIIKQGRIITHPVSERILPGITRSHLIDICWRNGIDVEQRPFTISELFSADEILVTSTTKLCRKVEMIDRISVGGKSESLASFLSESMYSQYKLCCKVQ